MCFVLLDLNWLQHCMSNVREIFTAWVPIPLSQQDPTISSRGVQHRRKQRWFRRIELSPRPEQSALIDGS